MIESKKLLKLATWYMKKCKSTGNGAYCGAAGILMAMAGSINDGRFDRLVETVNGWCNKMLNEIEDREAKLN